MRRLGRTSCLALAMIAGAATPAAAKPDLVVKAMGEPPKAVTPGASISLPVIVANRGSKRAKKSTTGFFLSADGRYDARDLALGRPLRTPALGRRKSDTGIGSPTVPAAAPAGAYTLIACADAARKVRERSERNNCRAARDRVTVAPAAVPPAAPAAPALPPPGAPAPPDTVAPAAPLLLSTEPRSPSNAGTRPLVRGSAEPGSTVSVFAGLACTGTAAATGTTGATGAFAIEVPVAANAATSLRASARDAAGNVSPCSLESLAFVHDGVPPAEPVLAATAPASPSADGVPVVSGTAEPGSTVRIFAGPCTGTPAATVAAADGGGFSSPVTVATDATTALRAQAADAAGNLSSCSAPLTYVEDSTAPAAPSLTGTTPASPAKDAAPVLAGTAEPGSTLAVHREPACAGTPLSEAAADGGGAFAVAVSAAPNAARTFTARAVDAAGNASACSAGLVYVHDTVAPDPPSISGFLPGSPGSDRAPKATGAAEAGSTVELFRTAGCTGAPTAAGSAADFAAGGLAVGTVEANATTTVYARASDAAGNASGCSAGAGYVHDDVAPPTPTLLSTAPPSPSPVGTPQVTGSGGQAGTRIDLFLGTLCTGDPAASVTAAGASWAATVDVPADATSQIRARATDPAGNASGCSAPLSYTEDSTAPAVPAIQGASPASPSPDATPTLSGSADPGSTVQLFTAGGCPGGSPQLSTIADGGGLWVLTPAVAPNATTNLRVAARDAAGNVSGCSAPLDYRHDSIAPPAPALTSTTPASGTPDNRPFLTGSAGGDAVAVDVYTNCFLPPVASGTPAQLAAGQIRPAEPLHNGFITLYAQSRDAAGNVSGCASPFFYTEQRPASTQAEVEPNNTAADANARTLRITEDHLIAGAFDAASAVDLFRVSATGQPVMRFETFAGTSGAADCPAGTDSTLQLTVNNSVVATDNDNGIGACSAITRFLDTSVFGTAPDVGVRGTGATGYTLEARMLRPVGGESEPNNQIGAADFLPGFDNYVTGVLSGSGDPDFYAIFVPSGWSVRIEAISRPGQLPACENTGAVTVSLHGNATGLPVTQTGAHGSPSPTTCALLDGTGAAPQVPAAHAIAAGGTFFIGVQTSGAGQQPYLLSWTVRQP